MTARDALGELGVDDPASHILVVTSPRPRARRRSRRSSSSGRRSPTAEVDRVHHARSARRGLGRSATRPGRTPDGRLGRSTVAPPDDRARTRSPTPTRTTSRSPTTSRSSGTSPVRRRASATSPDSTRCHDPEDAIGERVLAPAARHRRDLFARVPAAAVLRVRKEWRQLPRKGVVGPVLRRARARLHVLRDHDDPAADAVPRLSDVLAHRHARVDPRVHRASARSLSERLAPRPARGAARPARRRRRAHARSTCSACPRSPTRCSQPRSASASSSSFVRARPARPVPRHVHAARPRRGRRTRARTPRVRRVGLGGERLRVGDRLGAHDACSR